MSVFLAFFQADEPVNSLTGISALDQMIQLVINYAPKVIGAILLLVLAWIVASLVRTIARKGMRAMNVDEKLSSAGSDAGTSLIKTLSDVIYWIVFLCFIPAILGVLGLTGILLPIQAMLSSVLLYLPKVLGAALIFVLGMLVANIVRQLITSFLTNVGLNNFAENHSINTDFTKGGLAGLVGTIVYSIILLAVLSAALSTLNIDAISRPIDGVVQPILASIPNIFGAAILLAIAYMVAKIVRGLVRDILVGIGFNKIPNAIGLSNLPLEGDKSASAFVGHLTFIAIMFYATVEAAKILNFTTLSVTISLIAVIAAKVIAGIIILVIGMYIANMVAGLIKDSGVSNAALLSTIARVAILFLVGTMALSRMELGLGVVSWAFNLILGALAVAFAISFGVGGIDFAKKTIADVADSVKDDAPTPTAPNSGGDSPLDV